MINHCRFVFNILRSSSFNLSLKTSLPTLSCSQNFHCCNILRKIEKWPAQNDWVYPPQKPGEPPRPAWVCHYRENIKYPPKKMFYIAGFIRGMSIDEAIKQLSFIAKKGAIVVKEVLEEAQELAVRDHNVEYKSNLWVAQSFVTRSLIIKGIRRHGKMRHGVIHYRYSHYFVRLVEGPPPQNYNKRDLTGHEKLEKYYEEMRARTIMRTL